MKRRIGLLIWLSLMSIALVQVSRSTAVDDYQAELANLAPSHGLSIVHHQSLGQWITGAIVNGRRDYHGEIELQRELDLHPDQVARLRAILEMAYGVRNKRPGTRESAEASEVALLEPLPRILSPKQLARFEQLHCQIEGLQILRRKRYADHLALSDYQRKEIGIRVKDYSEKAFQLHAQFFDHQDEDAAQTLLNRINVLTRDLDIKILNTLTRDQRKQWIDLVGKKHDWSGFSSHP